MSNISFIGGFLNISFNQKVVNLSIIPNFVNNIYLEVLNYHF